MYKYLKVSNTMNQVGIDLNNCDNAEVGFNFVIGFDTSIRFNRCLNPNAFGNIMQYGETGIGLIDCGGTANIKRNFGHKINKMIRVEQTENPTRTIPRQKNSERVKIVEKNEVIVDKHSLELELSKVKLKEIMKYERRFNSEIKELLNLEAQEKILKNYAEVKRIQHKKANWGSPILALK
ncbi:TPA: hypothetical protein JI316_12815 [Acinetobacter baumannii]|nr:hypothetical protein [Acinetobacter baumannii]